MMGHGGWAFSPAWRDDKSSLRRSALLDCWFVDMRMNGHLFGCLSLTELWLA